MPLFKNRKGIIHSLNDKDPQVKKWIKDEQITRLTEAEVKAYAKSLGVKPSKKSAKKKADAPVEETHTVSQEDLDANPELAEEGEEVGLGEEAKEDAPARPIDLARAEYKELYGEDANPQWNTSTLNKKIEAKK